jgi:hypothetical protein
LAELAPLVTNVELDADHRFLWHRLFAAPRMGWEIVIELSDMHLRKQSDDWTNPCPLGLLGRRASPRAPYISVMRVSVQGNGGLNPLVVRRSDKWPKRSPRRNGRSI